MRPSNRAGLVSRELFCCSAFLAGRALCSRFTAQAVETLFLSRLEPAGFLLSLSAKKVDKEPTQQASAIELARMAETPEGRRSQTASSRFRLVGSPRVLRSPLKAKLDASGKAFAYGENCFPCQRPGRSQRGQNRTQRGCSPSPGVAPGWHREIATNHSRLAR